MIEYARCAACEYVQPLSEKGAVFFVCSACNAKNDLAGRVFAYDSERGFVAEQITAEPGHYKIISDEKALLAFIKWLPDIESTERYYLTLIARRKYCAALKLNDIVLKRVVCHKDEILNKIRQLEVPYGAYVTKQGDIIPQEALALYINVNPRSMVVAAKNTAKALVELICDNKLTMNPKSVALTEIHKARGTKHFVDIDIDSPEIVIEDAVRGMLGVLNKEAVSVIKTRGGIHIIIETAKTTTKDWYRKLKEMFVFDVTGDNMVPMPGGYQGGYTPIFWWYDEI